ncbi:MAG: acetate--CoA ligase family protein, partial [Planctomycetota bacterium]
ENYEPCVDLVVRQPNIGGVIALNVNLDRPEFARAFIKAKKKYKKPIVAVLVDDPFISQEFHKHQIPVFSAPERAVRAYRGLLEYRQIRKKLSTDKPRRYTKHYCSGDPRGRLSFIGEYESKKLLKRYGIPVTREVLCQDEHAALKAARQIGYPVVLKIASEKIIHKSDVGGVILNINNEQELKMAAKRVLRLASNVLPSVIPAKAGIQNSFLVQKMIKGGQEIIIGGRRDEIFGPAILFGLGGIFTEVLKDFALRICPITGTDAREMINEIKGNRILKGYRGKEKVNLNAITDALLKVSSLLLEHPEIKELDINPAIINERNLTVVDARIILS